MLLSVFHGWADESWLTLNWAPLVVFFTWILWILFLSLPPAPAASISSWVSIPRWAPSWLSLLKTAHAPSPLQAFVWPSGTYSLPHTAELQQPSLSSTAHSLQMISPGWTQQSQVSNVLTLPIPGAPRTGPEKAQACSRPPSKLHKDDGSDSFSPVSQHSALWLKDFFLKHLFQWIPSPPLDRLDMGTKGW